MGWGWHTAQAAGYRDVAPAEGKDEEASSFNPALVTINRKRFSTTQGEVELLYDGVRLDQYGDNIRLYGNEWRGHPDDYWIGVAKYALAQRRAGA